MKGPARKAVITLLEESEKQGSCLMANTPAQARQLSRAVACDIAVRPAKGLYVSKEYWISLSPVERNNLIVRGLAQQHETYIFAGPTAAQLHGLVVSHRYLSTIWISTTRISHSASRTYGEYKIQRILVTEDRPVERNGIKVTSFIRTVYDCLRYMCFPDALAIADSALRIKGISPQKLAANVRQLCAHKRDVTKVLDIIALADGRSESGGESIARAQMISLGFATPDLQRVVVDPLDANKSYRLDFAWDLNDGTLIVGELDGKQKYVDHEMTDGKSIDDLLLAERRREAHLTLADRPVRVMRFSLAEACDAKRFTRLLASYGVPRNAPYSYMAMSHERPIRQGRAAS